MKMMHFSVLGWSAWSRDMTETARDSSQRIEVLKWLEIIANITEAGSYFSLCHVFRRVVHKSTHMKAQVKQ